MCLSVVREFVSVRTVACILQCFQFKFWFLSQHRQVLQLGYMYVCGKLKMCKSLKVKN